MKKKKQGKSLKSGIIAVVALLAIGAAAGDKNDSQTTSQTTAPPAKVSDLPQSTKQEEEKASDTKPNSIKSGTYDISGESFTFSSSVINDVTGRWRLSLIASSKDVTEYAIDYYNTLFGSDDEIHAIVNFTLNTTTSISVLYDGMLDVTIHEHIDKEEHNANALFSGMLLKEYFINIETGDIEEISTTTEEPLVSEIETNTIEEQPQTEENNSVAEISTQNNTTNSNNNFNTYNNVSQQQTSDSYVLNSSTYKFHYPSCDSVAQIAPQNYSTSNNSRSEIMAQGYSPCGKCHP